MEAEIMGYIEEIKEIGDGSVRDGVLDGIDQGYFQREIQESSYEYQQRVERGEEVVVGVNKYTIEEDTSRRSSRSTRRRATANSTASSASKTSVTTRKSRPPSRRCRMRSTPRRTSCRTSSTPSKPT